MTTKVKQTLGLASLITSGNLVCLALCEVINSSDLNRNGGDIWVMPDADKVCTRFFFCLR